MSNPYAYYPKILHPELTYDIPQLKSLGSQAPFYFGGSQVPANLKPQGKGIIPKKSGKFHIQSLR
jgi:hypothetical protein